MSFTRVTHVAVKVPDLREAEHYYRQLFRMDVAFREAPTSEGWGTLPLDADWDDAEAAGIELKLSVLRRDGFILALESVEEHVRPKPELLSHIGLLLSGEELQAVRQRTSLLSCDMVQDGDQLLVFDDAYGIRWELTSSPELRSNGEARGAWLDLAPGS